jgi:hypothetical protein
MTKELFIKSIEAIKKQRDIDIEVAKHLGAAFPNAFEANLLPNNESLQNMLIEILQVEMNDIGTFWIEHFCWELDFGAKNDHLKVYANDREVPMSNAAELYDFLINREMMFD